MLHRKNIQRRRLNNNRKSLQFMQRYRRVDLLNFREVADPAVFPNRISAPPGKHPTAIRERKYRSSEVGHVGKLKESLGSIRSVGE